MILIYSDQTDVFGNDDMKVMCYVTIVTELNVLNDIGKTLATARLINVTHGQITGDDSWCSRFIVLSAFEASHHDE